jgi:hypothetical protein
MHHFKTKKLLLLSKFGIVIGFDVDLPFLLVDEVPEPFTLFDILKDYLDAPNTNK